MWGVDGVICFGDLKASVRVLIPKTQVWGSIADPTYERYLVSSDRLLLVASSIPKLESQISLNDNFLLDFFLIADKRFEAKITEEILWDYIFINVLAWEPSVAQVTYSYSRRLPALGFKLQF